MSLKTPVLEFEKIAEAAVSDGKIVKAGTAAGSVIHATAATEALLGIASHDAAITTSVRIMYDGVAKAKAGGTIAVGDLITSGAAGVAVTAAPGAGVNNRIVGMAMEAAVSGDYFRVLLRQGSVQG